MPQIETTQIINGEQIAYVTHLAVQQEVEITQGTIKNYLVPLRIEPNCVHIGTRSRPISRAAVARMKQLKQYSALLVHRSQASLRKQATK